MKKNYLLFLIIMTMVLSAACEKGGIEAQEPVRPVRVVELKEENYDITAQYVGFVAPERIKQYSFKTGGKVQEVFVEKGQEVKRGDGLMLLDGDSFRSALGVAKEQMESAAVPNYEFALEQYQNIKALFENGAVSKQELEAAELKMQIARAELERSSANYEESLKAVNDLTLVSDMDGFVADVLYSEGELAVPGYPAVMVHSGGKIVEVGVLGEDLGSIAVGKDVRVKAGDVETEGIVTGISRLPDRQTLMHMVKIALPGDRFAIGTIATVSVVVGSDKGVFVPISSVLKDNGDYVYVVENNRAVRKVITLGPVRGQTVKAEGLYPGERLIVEGMKSISTGDRVIIVEE